VLPRAFVTGLGAVLVYTLPMVYGTINSSSGGTYQDTIVADAWVPYVFLPTSTANFSTNRGTSGVKLGRMLYDLGRHRVVAIGGDTALTNANGDPTVWAKDFTTVTSVNDDAWTKLHGICGGGIEPWLPVNVSWAHDTVNDRYVIIPGFYFGGQLGAGASEGLTVGRLTVSGTTATATIPGFGGQFDIPSFEAAHGSINGRIFQLINNRDASWDGKYAVTKLNSTTLTFTVPAGLPSPEPQYPNGPGLALYWTENTGGASAPVCAAAGTIWTMSPAHFNPTTNLFERTRLANPNIPGPSGFGNDQLNANAVFDQVTKRLYRLDTNVMRSWSTVDNTHVAFRISTPSIANNSNIAFAKLHLDPVTRKIFVFDPSVNKMWFWGIDSRHTEGYSAGVAPAQYKSNINTPQESREVFDSCNRVILLFHNPTPTTPVASETNPTNGYSAVLLGIAVYAIDTDAWSYKAYTAPLVVNNERVLTGQVVYDRVLNAALAYGGNSDNTNGVENGGSWTKNQHVFAYRFARGFNCQ